MAKFSCKMCGGTFDVNVNETVGVCEYCGTAQTLPKISGDRKMNLYDRANHFRRNNEFDKASGIYEQILNEDPTDSEAYWSLVLCRYGIEYVEDPMSHKRVPTVHRAQYTSIFDDENYETAIKYADTYQKILYENEAKEINEIQKGILLISQNEEPFDVFICYKESDQNGGRTRDSVLAQELYNELTEEGFKVFLARVTLEDKLGTAYEPYIFAALNSSKVMVVVGTRKEHFNAVWVKNEWSRYLALIKKGEKKTLIPAYRDMDPYDLPEEFSHLQAQDMSKLGFMQDLVHGINKIVNADKSRNAFQSDQDASNYVYDANIKPLLERAFIFIEDGDFESGDEYLEKVLDKQPKCAEAYLGKLMIDLEVKNRKELAFVDESFEENNNYKRILRFGTPELVNEIQAYLNQVKKLYTQSYNNYSYTQNIEPQYNQSYSNIQENFAYQDLEETKRIEEAKRRNELIRDYNKRLERVTEEYKRIPSESRIKEEVKKRSNVKNLLIAAIICLIFYWPVGIALFVVRHFNIKKQVEQENAKYDRIRQEYRKLKYSKPTFNEVVDYNKSYNIVIRREDEGYFYAPYVLNVTIGNKTYSITKNSKISVSVLPGRYTVTVGSGYKTKTLNVNATKDTTILLGWNRINGEILPRIH